MTQSPNGSQEARKAAKLACAKALLKLTPEERKIVIWREAARRMKARLESTGSPAKQASAMKKAAKEMGPDSA